MILALTRRWYTDDSTTGTLVIDGMPECFILEDKVRTSADPAIAAAEIASVKIPGKTAIPCGTYPITMYASPKHGRVPLLHDVPGFAMIEMHPGNWAKNTDGCLLPGYTRKPDKVEQSVRAFEALVPKIEVALTHGEGVSIEIRQAEPSP